jgi:uncharacterized integral membrane protein
MTEAGAVNSTARKGPDLILKLLDRASVILMGILIFNLCLIFSAKPQDETFFDRLLNISVSTQWDLKLLKLSLTGSIMQLVVSLVYLYLNSKRLRRKTDRIRKSIVISLFASLLLCIVLPIIIYL